MDDIFQRLMESAGVPVEAHEATLGKLRALKRQYPKETPARLFARARKEGAPIPPSRCNHGVVHGECVVCDKKIGARLYFTSGGSHVHTRPTCEALRSGQDKVEDRGGNPAPIEVVRVYAGVADTRDPCKHCLPVRSSTAPRPRPAKAARRPASPIQVPTPLEQSKPPTVGDQIEWGGYAGVVSAITATGVRFSVGGISLTAPWGDRARVRRSRQEG